MSKSKRSTPINKINRETAKRLEAFSQLPFEKLNQWLPAGSGNFEKTKHDSKYRQTCGTMKYELKCKNDPESKKRIHLHCNKLDCSQCFIVRSSIKARALNERLTEFRRLSYRIGLHIGKIIHCSLILNIKREEFDTYRKFARLKKEFVYPLLKDIGILGGILFLHIWSNVCVNCQEKQYNCKCENPKLERRINMHVHIVGFGYLLNARVFNEQYPNCIYRNHLPRRTNAYYTIFYTLSKVALWRNERGMLMNSYNLFGHLHQRKFKVVKEYKIKKTDDCPKCHTPRIIDRNFYQQPIAERNYIISIPHKVYKIMDIEGLRKEVNKN